MKTEKIIRLASRVFIVTSAITFVYVSIMAFVDPQKVMDLVHVKLDNTDAFSSIRGVYGGVGLALAISLAYLLATNIRMGLSLLTLLWGSYAFSRVITIFAEGPLGSFGMQWMIIESIFFILALTLLFASQFSKENKAQ